MTTIGMNTCCVSEGKGGYRARYHCGASSRQNILNWPVANITAKLEAPFNLPFPNLNSPILSPSLPYLVLRDTLCSYGAYGMTPKYCCASNAP